MAEAEVDVPELLWAHEEEQAAENSQHCLQNFREATKAARQYV